LRDLSLDPVIALVAAVAVDLLTEVEVDLLTEVAVDPLTEVVVDLLTKEKDPLTAGTLASTSVGSMLPEVVSAVFE
jgi:hypothetical protein